MTVLQISTLVVVALSGTAIAVHPSPLREALLLGVFGFALTALFFAFQAPDVALSELAVSGVAMPMIILFALRRIADQAPEDDASGPDQARTADPQRGQP